MFLVNEADASAIRAAYQEGGEFSAAIELRRIYPCISDNENARRIATSIASWPERLDIPLSKKRTKKKPS